MKTAQETTASTVIGVNATVLYPDGQATMSENNNQPRTLSDVALERVMRDVLGMWELPAKKGRTQSESTVSAHDIPDEDQDSVA